MIFITCHIYLITYINITPELLQTLYYLVIASNIPKCWPCFLALAIFVVILMLRCADWWEAIECIRSNAFNKLESLCWSHSSVSKTTTKERKKFYIFVTKRYLSKIYTFLGHLYSNLWCKRLWVLIEISFWLHFQKLLSLLF